jgi:hypothetical protein
LFSLIYFYAHYVFAGISIRALAMYTPFLIVVTLEGQRRRSSPPPCRPISQTSPPS